MSDQVANSDEVKEPKQIRLVDVEIKDENIAINVMVSFLALAQSKGAYSLEESSKIWECINVFKKTDQDASV